jgi:hypothetical protein
MADHARLSPSNKRWPNCPGSIREEAAYQNNSGAAAIDGTGSHHLLELCLKTGNPSIKASAYIGHIIATGLDDDKPEGWLVEADRAARVQIALDYIRHRDEEIGGVTLSTEGLVSPGAMFGRDDWWGTCDVTLQGIEAPVIEVIDYKDGQMYVAAKDNTQLISYAIGVCYERKATAASNPTIRMTIIQPKNTKEPIRFQEMTLQELSVQAEILKEAAIATDDPDAPLIAGEWCTWCRHKDACPERTAKGLDGVGLMVEAGSPLFETLQDGNISVADMPSEKLAAIKDAKKIVMALFDNVDAEVMVRLDKGESVPGYAIGTGNGSNSWNTDLEMVVKKLKGMKFKNDDLYPPKLVSPTQALKKADLTERQQKRIKDELIVYKEGKKAVVKSNFKRETPEQMFADVAPIAVAPVPAEPETKDAFEGLTFL